MSLLSMTQFKSNFPLWNKYCLDESNEADDTILQNELDNADKKFAQYVIIEDGETLPNWLNLHLFNLARKFCFDRKHGDTEFEHKPSILKDFNDSIAALEKLKISGTPIALAILNDRISASGKDKISITGKVRKFGPNGGFTGYLGTEE